MQVSGFRIYFLEPGYFFSKILSDFRKKIVALHIVVKIPEFNEQGKIADCLRRIDTLITLHQRKLEKLQNIKKSCLEKMFV